MAEEIEFDALGTTLRGRFVHPGGAEQVPVVILQGGLGGPAEATFPLADRFVAAGLGVFVFDHAGIGHSDGEPRQHFDPARQARDLRHAITWLTLRSDVDAERIGLWGISLGGATALAVAAVDRRVGAVVALIPPVSGRSARHTRDRAELAELDALIERDRRDRMLGKPPLMIPLHGDEGAGPAVFHDAAGNTHLRERLMKMATFRNVATVASLDHLFEMELMGHADRITAPTLMVLADRDRVAPVADAYALFEMLPEPKEKLEFAGMHYEILGRHMPEILAASVDFLTRNLKR